MGDKEEASSAITTDPLKEDNIIRQDKTEGKLEEKLLFETKEEDSKRTKAAKELANTEAAYVDHLSNLIKGYVKPLSWSGIVDPALISGIFSNVEILLRFHTQFLKDIEGRLLNWSDSQKLGDIFLNLAPYLKLYTQYCMNYDHSIQLVQSQKRDNPKFAEFLKTAQEGHRFGGAYITTYLIMPIQRLPRYALLLDALLKNTPASHDDYHLLKEALSKVREYVDFVNEACIKAENQQRVMTVSRAISMEHLVTPTRRYRQEFPCDIYASLSTATPPNKKSKELEFNPSTIFLFNDLLVIAESRLTKSKYSITSQSLHLIWVRPDLNHQAKCQVIIPEVTFNVSFPDVEKKEQFVSEFESACTEFLSLPGQESAKAAREGYSLMIVDDVYRACTMNKDSRRIEPSKKWSTKIRSWTRSKSADHQKTPESSADSLPELLKLNISNVSLIDELGNRKPHTSRSIDAGISNEQIEQTASFNKKVQKVKNEKDPPRRRSVPHSATRSRLSIVDTSDDYKERKKKRRERRRRGSKSCEAGGAKGRGKSEISASTTSDEESNDVLILSHSFSKNRVEEERPLPEDPDEEDD